MMVSTKGEPTSGARRGPSGLAYHKRCRRGFTLIELVMMIGVGAVLFTSISKAVLAMNEMIIENRNYVVALNIAKRQMAVMNNSAYPAVAAEAALAADANYPQFIPTQEVSAVAGATDTIRLITVRVRLQSVSGPVLIRLDTYRSNVITFGNGT